MRMISERKRGVLFSLFVLMLCFSFVAVASAADVAYIYRSSYKIDENIINAFTELGMSVDLIDEDEMPSNFDDYRMIFLGDERYRKANQIPVDKTPSIIANYYFGEEWGLTDYDGVSKLAANSPLSVKKDYDIIQVYTQAKYSLGSISIPYYYLDDENKAPEMQSVARTYIGMENNYDFGDVISYSNEGIGLRNGKTSKEKICFFGIVESDFWTEDAKDLFLDCVGFVGTACYEDDECPDDEVGDEYCVGLEVYEDVTSYSCENEGTMDSDCVEDTNPEFVEECSDWCVDGECLDVICYYDSDCYDYDMYTQDTCNNPRTPESFCSYEPIKCFVPEDCGDNGFLGDLFCQGNDSYQDFLTYTCNNPGDVGSNCSSGVGPLIVEDCDDYCENGSCMNFVCKFNSDCNDEDSYTLDICENPATVNAVCENRPIECIYDLDCEDFNVRTFDQCILANTTASFCRNTPMNCLSDLDCGVTGFINESFCDFSFDNVLKYYQTSICVNPSTLDSDCNISISPVLIQECDDQNNYTIDYCVENGHAYCKHDALRCLVDEDCSDDFYTNWTASCFGDDVNTTRELHNFSCLSNSCDEVVSVEENITLCEFGCAGGVCNLPECSDLGDNDGDFLIDADDPGCHSDFDIGNPFSYEPLDNNESNQPIECLDDADCSDDFYSVGYCSVDDLFRDLHEFACGDYLCVENVTSEFFEDCGNDSCDDFGENYCVGLDVYHNKTCYDRGCEIDNCFVQESFDEQFVTTCDFGCENATCLNGEHDVALIDFSSSIGGIRLEYLNGTDLLGDTPVLNCNQEYLVWIKPENQGDFNENVIFNGAVGLVLFSHYSITDFMPGDTSEKYRTINFALEEGLYNISVMAIIFEDDNLGNNLAQRQIEIVCPEPECVEDFECDDGLFCNGEEICLDNVCQPGLVVNCSGFDLSEISSCVEDGNPFTWDYFSGFDSYCDEDLDSCAIGEVEFESECSVLICDAKCENDWDCDDTPCDDGCIGNDYYEFEDVENNCLDCVCEVNVCDVFEIFSNDGRCTECQVPLDCGENYFSEDYCISGDVYSDLHEFFCEVFECNEQTTPSFVEDCGEESYSENYCLGDDIYRNHTLPFCLGGDCGEDVLIEFVEECAYECVGGYCVDQEKLDVVILIDSNGVNQYGSDNAHTTPGVFSCKFEWGAVCRDNFLSGLEADLASEDVEVDLEVYDIAGGDSHAGFTDCRTGTALWYDAVTYFSESRSDEGGEYWGPAAEWLVLNHDWRNDSEKLIIVISDTDPTGRNEGNDEVNYYQYWGWRRSKGGQNIGGREQDIVDRLIALANDNEVTISVAGSNIREYNSLSNYYSGGDHSKEDVLEAFENTALGTGGIYRGHWRADYEILRNQIREMVGL